MLLNPEQIAHREKLILAGLYLSKYDSLGLQQLGFENFREACNVVGYALGAKPGNVKNYRDEFDPLFPNPRKGRHKRAIRGYCLRVFEEYRDLDFGTFSDLIRSLFRIDEVASSAPSDETNDGESSFARRLITGLAAERYFESVQAAVPAFSGYAFENTTRLGCGYDFRLVSGTRNDFLAVEVKGLQGRTGALALTPKEYEVASALTSRCYLFVVKNFVESPFHEIYQDPIAGPLRFLRKERVTIQVSWSTSV